MNRPDVVLISPYPRIAYSEALTSGPAWYTVHLADALSDQGMLVTVIADQLDGEPDVAYRGPVTIERRYRFGLSGLPTAAMAATRLGAPLAHVQHETFLFGGLLSIPGLLPALTVLRHAGLGPVVTMHHVVDHRAIDKEFTRMNRISAPVTLARTGLSGVQRTLRSMAATSVVHERSFREIIPEASVIPLGLHRHDSMPSNEAKRSLGLNPDTLIALCFGFVSPYKGLEVALEASRLTGPNVELVVAGGPVPDSGQEILTTISCASSMVRPRASRVTSQTTMSRCGSRRQTSC